jgi:hypothetical protein
LPPPPPPLVVLIGNFKTVRSTQYKNGRERAVKKPLQQEGVAILTEDSEDAAIAVEAKSTTTKKLKRQSFDGRMPQLKGFTCDLKDAELSSGNRKVCKCISTGSCVVSLVIAR